MKFHMWSNLHYFMMISPFMIAFVLHYIYKNKSQRQKQIAGIVMSWIAILLLVARNVEIFINHNYQFHYEIVPLQVCHFANFVLLYAFYKKSDVVFGFAFTFNLILAYLSLVFADGLENYTTILSARGQAYIWGHILIVVITLFAYTEGFINLTRKGYLSVVKIVTSLYFISVFVNNFFRLVLNQKSNYFYSEHPEAGTPLEYFYSLGETVSIGGFEVNLIYMISMTLFGIFVSSVFYLLAFEVPVFIKNYQNQKFQN